SPGQSQGHAFLRTQESRAASPPPSFLRTQESKAASPPPSPGQSQGHAFLRTQESRAALVLVLTGAVVRLLWLGEIPAGLYMDEASIGYEAWALGHYGITRNGYAWPVNFVAWGGGQSALYAYLSIPLIAAFDLTVWSTRLLMAVTGTASLLLFWRIAARDQPATPLRRRGGAPPPPSPGQSQGHAFLRTQESRAVGGRQGHALHYWRCYC
ncbi:MAG: hypothetical protein OXU40_04905, partial [Nitrospira sp.]|nr:hypothetical protein [Nitrospira sp.]